MRCARQETRRHCDKVLRAAQRAAKRAAPENVKGGRFWSLSFFESYFVWYENLAVSRKLVSESSLNSATARKFMVCGSRK